MSADFVCRFRPRLSEAKGRLLRGSRTHARSTRAPTLAPQVLTGSEQLQEMGPSLWAAQPLLLGLALFYVAYVGAAAWLRVALGAGAPEDIWEAALAPFAHCDFGPRGTPLARAAWLAALAAYLLLGPLLLCLSACTRCRGCLPRLGAPRADPADLARGVGAAHLLLTLLLQPPFPENAAWWLTLLPCTLLLGQLARWLLLVPRLCRRRAAGRPPPRSPNPNHGRSPYNASLTPQSRRKSRGGPRALMA